MLETFGWFAVCGFGAGLGWHLAAVAVDVLLSMLGFDDDQ